MFVLKLSKHVILEKKFSVGQIRDLPEGRPYFSSDDANPRIIGKHVRKSRQIPLFRRFQIFHGTAIAVLTTIIN